MNQPLVSEKKNILFIVVSVFLLLTCVLVSVFYLYPIYKQERIDNQAGKEYETYYNNLSLTDKAYYERLEGRTPTIMQADVVTDIKNGVNTPLTQSNIYFITHRYFDTNGNIYEIYDYIKKNQELAFLNEEASKIYPEVFSALEARRLPVYFNDDSTYVFSAYIEVLHNYGLANVAALATVANQYASSAYMRFAKATISSSTPQGVKDMLLKNNERDITKAKEFLVYADTQVKDIIDGKAPQSLLPRDRLVGVNQYAATLRYIEALGYQATSSKNANELFTFSMDYAKSSVPELYYFTSLLNASTLAILPASSPSLVTEALNPILRFDPSSESTYKGGVFNKILTSKNERISATTTRRTDIYSLWNTVMLANKSPQFKDWLEENGWEDVDFR